MVCESRILLDILKAMDAVWRSGYWIYTILSFKIEDRFQPVGMNQSYSHKLYG